MRNLVVLAIALLSIYACVGMPGPIQLNGTEVMQYNGTNLSPISGVYENAIAGTQYIDVNNYTLKITGLVSNPQEYTYAQVLGHQHYSKVVQLDCVEGWNATILWEGVLVKDLIAEAGPQPGATTVIFKAADNYTTSFPLSYIEDNDIIMAYKMNNVTLPSEQGFPFMLVAESKWGYKWIKWITEIELSNDTNYQGYWESRGYSDSGNMNETFIK